MNTTAIWSTVQHFTGSVLVAVQHVRITVDVRVVPAGQASPAAIPAAARA